MVDIQNLCVDEGILIGEAIQKLDEAGEKVVLVTHEEKLVGVVTDGDVRRWILKKGSMSCTVAKMMCRSPRVVYEDEIYKAKTIMLEQRLESIPVLNKNKKPIDIVFLRDIVTNERVKKRIINKPVVIMAGGKGTRLHPYTNILPKPLIPIGDITILERIIDSFQKNGCNDFWLTLNYKRNLIKAYLDDQERDYQINYVEEDRFLGTCGSLKLLENEIKETFFLSNCDVLLDIDYAKLYDFHLKNRNEITMVTSLKRFQIPYGVIELEKGGNIKKITEKPEYNYQINTGIYVVEPSVINDIPEDSFYQMPDLVNKLLGEGRAVGAYPITEGQWSDMGEFGEMQKMMDSLKIDTEFNIERRKD